MSDSTQTTPAECAAEKARLQALYNQCFLTGKLERVPELVTQIIQLSRQRSEHA